MFINFWYAAALASEIEDRPVRVRMLGQNFALFRDTVGRVHCLADVCVHRGGSLGAGKVRGDCIQCPYHGWEFDGAGHCRKIPSLGGAARIPARARVDSYPTVERYGIVFVFLGDLPEAERPPILDIPQWGTDGWRTVSYTYDWQVHFQRSVENSLDAPHVDFVHNFGAMENDSAWKLAPERSVVEDRPPWGAVHLIDTKTQHFEHGHNGPSHTWTWLYFGQGEQAGRFLFFTYITPIDETRVRRFLVHVRNRQLDPKLDPALRDANDVAEREDRVVIEALSPRESPTDTARELLVADDEIMVRYRQRLRDWESRGWRIDSAMVARLAKRSVWAIPSPARREGGSWVLDPIPLRASAEIAARR